MPSESYFKYNGYTLWLGDGFLIAFELLAYKTIQTIFKDSNVELNNIKAQFADDSFYMVATGSFACIDFDEEFSISESTRQILLTVINNVIESANQDPCCLTRTNMNTLCNEARAYLVKENKFTLKCPEVIATDYYSEQLPLVNYIHAFELIKLLFMGEIKDSDRKFLLVG